MAGFGLDGGTGLDYFAWSWECARALGFLIPVFATTDGVWFLNKNDYSGKVAVSLIGKLQWVRCRGIRKEINVYSERGRLSQVCVHPEKSFLVGNQIDNRIFQLLLLHFSVVSTEFS